jgi:hypothetical protein
MKGFQFEPVCHQLYKKKQEEIFYKKIPTHVKAEIEQIPYKPCILDTACLLHIATVT